MPHTDTEWQDLWREFFGSMEGVIGARIRAGPATHRRGTLLLLERTRYLLSFETVRPTFFRQFNCSKTPTTLTSKTRYSTSSPQSRQRTGRWGYSLARAP